LKKILGGYLDDVFFAIGSCLIAYGVWQIHPGAGYIVLGSAFVIESIIVGVGNGHGNRKTNN
jgi:hypothetical protein